MSRDGEKILIKRLNPWAALAGMPPLYYFRGEARQVQDGIEVSGRVLMSSFAKYFIYIWFCIVVLAFAGVLVWSAALAIEAMRTFSTGNPQGLATAGFLIGAIAGLGLFGCLIVVIVRVISTSQRAKLIGYITRPHGFGSAI